MPSRKHGVASLNELLPANLRVVTEEPGVTWSATIPEIKHSITSSDPVSFLQAIIKLLEIYPKLSVYIFKVVK